MSIDPRKGRAVVKGKRDTAQPKVNAQYSLEDAFSVFYGAKKAEGMRQRTLEGYANHWRYFRDWLASAYPDVTRIDEINAVTIRDYVSHMTSKKKYEGVAGRETDGAGLSPYTVALRLRDIRTMFNFLAEERIVALNPVSHIKQPRFDDEDKPTFTEEQFARLIAAPDTDTFAGLRDRTLMLTLADGGFRIEEALRLTTEHFDAKSRCVHLPGWMNKNRKPRVVPLTAEVTREILTLINENKYYFGDVEHIFLSNYGEPLKSDHFRKRLKLHAQKAGIDDGSVQISPHQFRAFFLTQFLLNGGDLFSAQRIVAHASIQTTRRYVKLTDENIRQQHAEFSPLAKLGKMRVVKRRQHQGTLN
ncbi:site-specific tyrosine recombinase XerD [Paenibacillus vulneris]|uniref:Tyrosine-type recombinase/integrase n=1 Tax=Paenibacillus vulneris TaxID=1133364 RepID=A0ABW3UT17_9BACL